MSAESTLAFYGVRFEVANEEIISVEERSHPLLVKARQNGLKTYWGNFAFEEGDQYLLFIGDKIGILGAENDEEVQISIEELVRRARETSDKLKLAGILEPPMLYLAWEPDN